MLSYIAHCLSGLCDGSHACAKQRPLCARLSIRLLLLQCSDASPVDAHNINFKPMSSTSHDDAGFQPLEGIGGSHQSEAQYAVGASRDACGS